MQTVTMPIEALCFAINAHKDQVRKNGSGCYISHPIRCVKILEEAGVVDPEVKAAAVLHDVPEDTPFKVPDVRARFGDRVARIVEQVTDDKELPPGVRKMLQVQHAGESDVEAQYVKTADTIDNLEDMCLCPPEGWNFERIQSYFMWKKLVMDRIVFAEDDQIAKNLKARFARALEGTITVSLPDVSHQPMKVVKLPGYHTSLNLVQHFMKAYFMSMGMGENQEFFMGHFNTFSSILEEMYAPQTFHSEGERQFC